MASAQRKDSREDHLNDSWVELHFQQNQLNASQSDVPSHQISRSPLPSSAMEKLLLEAQREFSRGSSRVGSATSTAASSRGSPRSPHSPNNEPSAMSLLSEVSTIQENPSPIAPPQTTITSIDPTQMEWIDLSSRPEAVPPREWETTFKHPRRHKMSMRNSGGVFSLKNLPLLLLTHACTFFLGAATMLFVLKKYCKWAPALMTATHVD